MREILFRAKGKGSGKWLYGYYARLSDAIGLKDVLCAPAKNPNESNHTYGIDPATVGQYTGLKDKNGTRIFEGDIVKITGFHTTAIAAVKYVSPLEKLTSWGWYFDDNHGHTYHLESQAFCRDYNAIIIGNICDNPELLKGE